MNTWQPGDAVVLRGIWHRKIWWASTARTVVDSADLIALYWQAGTPEKAPAVRSTPCDLLDNQIALVDRQWVDTDVLMLAIPGSAHNINLMWGTGTRKLRCWYVDLNEPLRRTAIGFDTMDQLLDIVISPDRSEWHWKDEDEFAEAIALGVYSLAEARAIRLEGERVIECLQAGGFPFYDGWEDWIPPAEWGISELPQNWAELP